MDETKSHMATTASPRCGVREFPRKCAAVTIEVAQHIVDPIRGLGEDAHLASASQTRPEKRKSSEEDFPTTSAHPKAER